MAACVRPGRIFISRLLNELRNCAHRGARPVTREMRKDMLWWRCFLVIYNGVSIIWMHQRMVPDEVLATDASSGGLGGYLVNDSYFHMRVPCRWLGVNIAYLELWAIIVALKVWGPRLKGIRFTVKCDNEAVVAVLSHGRSRDMFLQAGMWEVAWLLAIWECELRVVYLPSVENRVPDWLSRWSSQ